jgi:hypothetical protein
MHKLYCVKFEDWSSISDTGIVYLFTAESEKDAEAKGLTMINPDYVSRYRLVRVEFVCNTPDEVLCFEPC